MAAEIRIKKGAALCLRFAFTETDGTASDLTSAEPAAQIRDVFGHLLATLSFTTEAPGVLQATVADTRAWPAGALRCDVRVLRDGLPAISETFPIWVDQAVTQL